MDTLLVRFFRRLPNDQAELRGLTGEGQGSRQLQPVVSQFNSLSLVSALFSPVCSQPNQMLPVG